MPVERTAKTKLPSREASRETTAFHISGLSITFGIVVLISNILLHLFGFDELIIEKGAKPFYPIFAVKLEFEYFSQGQLR